MTDPASLLDRLIGTTSELRELIAEGHRTIKDLKVAKKDVERFKAEVEDYMREVVIDEINRQVTLLMLELHKTLKSVMDSSRQHILDEFDKLAKQLLEGPDDKVSMYELVDALVDIKKDDPRSLIEFWAQNRREGWQEEES